MKRIPEIPAFADFVFDAGAHSVYSHPLHNIWYTCDECEEHCFMFFDIGQAFMHAEGVDSTKELSKAARYFVD